MAVKTVTPETMATFIAETKENRAKMATQKAEKPAESPPPEVAATPEASQPVETPETVEADVKAQAIDETPPEKGETPEQYSDRVQKRINKLVRDAKEAEEFAQSQFNRARAAEQRLGELETEVSTLREKVSPPPEQAADEKPDSTKYSDAFKYAEDLAAWSARQAVANDRKAQAEAAAKAAHDAALKEHIKRVEKAAKDIPDYSEVVDNSTARAGKAIQEFIFDSDIGPLIGYHFAKNPAEADRINALTPGRAFAELGKLEERLSKPTGTPLQESKTVGSDSRAQSRAPAPITPIPAAKTTVTSDPSKMSYKELRDFYRKQESDKRRH